MMRHPPRSTLFPYPTLSRSPSSQTSAPSSGAALIRLSYTTPRSTAPLCAVARAAAATKAPQATIRVGRTATRRSEEHTSELQSRLHLVCRLLLEKKEQYTIS